MADGICSAVTQVIETFVRPVSDLVKGELKIRCTMRFQLESVNPSLGHGSIGGALT